MAYFVYVVRKGVAKPEFVAHAPSFGVAGALCRRWASKPDVVAVELRQGGKVILNVPSRRRQV
jgi:hypothetical protein